MERPSTPGQEGAGDSPAQRLSLEPLAADLVGQNLHPSSLSLNGVDATVLLACVNMLYYDNTHGGDFSTSLATLAESLSRCMDPPIAPRSPETVRPLSPAVNSLLSSVSSDLSVLAPSVPFPCQNENSQDALHTQFRVTDALVPDLCGGREKDKTYVDAVEDISKCTAAVAQRGLRNSDSSTSTTASHNSGSNRSSTMWADGQQQWLINSAASTSPGKIWALNGSFVEEMWAGDDKQTDDPHTHQQKAKLRWSCGQGGTTRTPILSAVNICEEAYEQERQSSSAALTGTDHLHVFSDDIRRPPQTRQNAFASSLDEAISSCTHTNHHHQQQQHSPTKRVEPGAPASVHHVFGEDSLVFHHAGSSCATDGSLLDIRASSNGSIIIDPSDAAGTPPPPPLHESPPARHDRLLRESDQSQFFRISPGILKTIEQIRRVYVGKKFQVHSDVENCVQGKFAEEESHKNLYKTLSVSPKSYAREKCSFNMKADEPSLKESTGEYCGGTKTNERKTQQTPHEALFADCPAYRAQANFSDGNTKGENVGEVQSDGQTKVKIVVEGFGSGAVRSQDKEMTETHPKKVQKRDDQDYLQMARKLPKFAGVIFDRLHMRWVSTYHDKETRKVMRKYFGVRKHGFEHAYQMAVKHRKMKMSERQNDGKSLVVMQRKDSNSLTRAATEVKGSKDRNSG